MRTDETLTDADHAELMRTRPVTQPPIGASTISRRHRDAILSNLMLGHERPRPGVRLVRSPWTNRRYVVRTTR